MPPRLLRKFSRKLIVSFVLVTGVSIVLASALSDRWFRANLISELGHSLETQATLITTELNPAAFTSSDSISLEQQAQRLGHLIGARISLIGKDGRVLGDSEVNRGDLRAVENHADRPEVKLALQGQVGSSQRLSRTVHEELMYVAIPMQGKSGTVGAVRVALPLAQIQKKMDRIRGRVILFSGVALLLALVVASAVARSLSRPVTTMSEVAEQLAAGNYDARIVDLPADEHGRLGETLNTLAARVQSKIDELSYDKAHLATILFNMTDAVVAVDVTGRITVVNPALSRLFGVDPVHAKGKQFLEGLRHNELNQLLHTVLIDRKPRMDEVRAFAPEEHVFEAYAVPLTEGPGRNAGALLVLHDITRIRKLEQVRRDFVANVSHELRTPLASIKGFAETLRMGGIDDGENRMEFLELIEKQADRMATLVNDLLDLSAIESGQRSPVKEAVLVGEIITEVVDGLKPLANRRAVELKNEMTPGLAPVFADRLQIRQVFVNLVDNAVKFNRQDGSVSIRARVDGEMMAIAVEDTGPGIPSQDVSRIFERFYRVDKARSREMGGTGLGLSIVKHLVEAHGGTVAVESTQGKGSVFTVHLPLYK